MEVFQHKVFRMLVKEGLISEERVRMILSCRHTGFHVHNEGRVVTTSKISQAKFRLTEKSHPATFTSENQILIPQLTIMKKSVRTLSQLPNAPLVEVVFEFRWGLEGGETVPVFFRKDPGYHVLVDGFVDSARKHGFVHSNRMTSPEPIGHSVDLRFYKGPDQAFPIWQIGPGIFACNESTAYEWQRFKNLALDGLKVVIASYPSMKHFRIQPIHLELRYIDSFDSSLLRHTDLLKFVNDHTSLAILLPEFMHRDPISGPLSGNLVLSFPLETKKDTQFAIRIANAHVNDKETILLESKIVTKSSPIEIGKSSNGQIRNIGKWLDFAHSVTSPFFKQFIKEPLMKKFRQVSDD